MKPLCLQRAYDALKKQGDVSTIIKKGILNLEGEKEYVICGTMYKDMKLKPCILDEYIKARHVGDSVGDVTADIDYVSMDDALYLEDDLGRIHLSTDKDVFDMNVARFISGIVIAVKGCLKKEKFLVKQIYYPALPSSMYLPLPVIHSPRYVAIVSGLSIGEESIDPLPMQLFADYVTGYLGNAADHQLMRQVGRVIIAGNSLHRVEVKDDQRYHAKKRGQKLAILPHLTELDLFLTQLAASVPVDVMPGESDPANFTMPQQPLHPCLFSSASSYSTFTLRTNPCHINMNGVHFLGTSGQNINDMSKYATTPTNMDLLEDTLRCQVICPTAPDTLACYPFQKLPNTFGSAPFIIKRYPHVYFAGNQPKYQSKLIEDSSGARCRLICVPRFSKSGTVVLVNIQDLSTTTITFKGPNIHLGNSQQSTDSVTDQDTTMA